MGWHIVCAGDGAGILCALPHEFLRERVAEEFSVQLPNPGSYGVAMVFLPTDDAKRKECREIFERIGTESGNETLLWRPVPTDNSELGPTAVSTEPVMEQWFFRTREDSSHDDEVQVQFGLGFESMVTNEMGSVLTFFCVHFTIEDLCSTKVY